MTLGENMTFFEGRMEVLMEQIRDGINNNAAQSERIADALEKIASCVNEEGRLDISTRDYKYK